MRHGKGSILTSKSVNQALLPFAGLGLDAEDLQRKARPLRLVALEAPAKNRGMRLMSVERPGLSGYGLLVSLCRETRGT